MSHTVSNPYEQDPAVAMADANPYLGAHAAPAPDLDAGAPSLRNAEQQRVNRKALLFLGGIILLLMMMAVLVFRGSSKSSDATKPSEEQVSIPTLADATPPLPQQQPQMSSNVEPIAVQPTAQDMPPLPQQSYANTMPPPPPGYESPAQVRREPTLMERRMGVDPNAMGATGQPGSQDAYSRALAMTQAAMGMHPPAADANAAQEDFAHKATAARALRNPDTLLVRGTLLRCVLETRIISEAEGFTSCILTEPVYSINGRRLLLDRGSKIYGSYKARPKGNRIEVVWDRITTPNGYDVSMASPGVDPLGSAGYPGQLDAHWGSRITSALMVSLLSDAFKYAAAKNGPQSSTVTQGVVVTNPYESNTANTLDRLANQAAEEGMAHAPTVTINQGSLVSVYVARDVDFTEVVGH